jgi:hypothetical protein
MFAGIYHSRWEDWSEWRRWRGGAALGASLLARLLDWKIKSCPCDTNVLQYWYDYSEERVADHRFLLQNFRSCSVSFHRRQA